MSTGSTINRPIHVALTGATGHVGSAVLAELLDRPDIEVTCLVRAEDAAGARRRVDVALSTWLDPAGLADAARRVHAITADITQADLGLDPGQHAELAGWVTHIVHCAASVRFDDTIEGARATNVEGAAHVIRFAERAHAQGNVRRLTLVSTAFVSGTTARPFSEHELDLGQSFRTTYERSKFEAELLAREAMTDLPVTVVRPSIVVGHSTTGRTANFNVLYAPIRLLLRSGTDVTLPIRANLPLDIIPVDWAATVIVEAMAGGEDGTTYAAAAGPDAITMQQLATATSQAFGVEAPRLLPAGASDMVVGESMTALRGALSPRARTVLDVYQPYLGGGSEFDNWRGTHLLSRAGHAPPDPLSVIRRSLDYAHATKFGRHLQPAPARDAA